MNGGCRLHARGTPEKIFKFVFTPPVRPVPTLVTPSALASWLPHPRACDIWLHGKWTYKYISYVNSDEIYPTPLPILSVVPTLIVFTPVHPCGLSLAVLLSLCLILLITDHIFSFPFLCYKFIYPIYYIIFLVQLFWHTQIFVYSLIYRLRDFGFPFLSSCIILFFNAVIFLFSLLLPLNPSPFSPFSQLRNHLRAS